MAKTIVIANQKGGVAKTTTATAMAYRLNEKGFTVLIVDTDPQSNATDTVLENMDIENTVYDLFAGKKTANEVIKKVGNIDLIQGDLRMSAADMQFISQGREYILKKALEPIKENYDYIIIDSPPALGIITINALTAADCMVIPMIADRYSLQGLSQLSATIATVREYSNPELEISGILLTRFNERTVLARDIHDTIEELAKSWGTKLFKTTIRQSVSLPESQTQQQSIFEYAPYSTTAQDYRKFVEELLG